MQRPRSSASVPAASAAPVLQRASLAHLDAMTMTSSLTFGTKGTMEFRAVTEKVVAKRKKGTGKKTKPRSEFAGVEASGNVVSHGEFGQITRDIGVGEHRWEKRQRRVKLCSKFLAERGDTASTTSANMMVQNRMREI